MSIKGSRNDVETTLLPEITHRQGGVETTSKFSRSTSRPYFDQISTSKRRRVPAGHAVTETLIVLLTSYTLFKFI